MVHYLSHAGIHYLHNPTASEQIGQRALFEENWVLIKNIPFLNFRRKNLSYGENIINYHTIFRRF